MHPRYLQAPTFPAYIASLDLLVGAGETIVVMAQTTQIRWVKSTGPYRMRGGGGWNRIKNDGKN